MSDFKAKSLKCTKFTFCWGYAETLLGQLSALTETC